MLVPLRPASLLPPMACDRDPALVLCIIKFAVIKESSCGIWTVLLLSFNFISTSCCLFLVDDKKVAGGF